MKHSILLLFLVIASALQTQAAPRRLAGLSNSFCIRQTNGEVFCTGDNSSGQLGLNLPTTSDIKTPTKMVGVSAAQDICIGNEHGCVVEQGNVKCAGENQGGLLGNGGSADSAVMTPVSTLQNGDALRVFCGYQHSCTVISTGVTKCWGDNKDGEFGSGTASGVTSTPLAVVTTALQAGNKIIEAGMGHSHTCFLTQAGPIYCSGKNEDGQLGQGNKVDSLVLVKAGGNADTTSYVSIASGYAHNCAVTVGGAARCWGETWDGSVGDGQRNSVLSPKQIIATGAFEARAAFSGSLILMATGAVKSFGSNTNGELGYSTTARVLSPVDFVGGMTGIVDIAGGYGTTCILTTSGEVKCLGSNMDGQFGNGGTSSSESLQTWQLVAQPVGTSAPVGTSPPVASTVKPTAPPTQAPVIAPTRLPTESPTSSQPTQSPTGSPTTQPTELPTRSPTSLPTEQPTAQPSQPTSEPTRRPTGDLSKPSSASTMAASMALNLAVVFAMVA